MMFSLNLPGALAYYLDANHTQDQPSRVLEITYGWKMNKRLESEADGWVYPLHLSNSQKPSQMVKKVNRKLRA